MTGGGLGAAPEIRTERLRLHGHGVLDFEGSVALWSDPQVVRYIGGRPFTREEVWARLLRYVGHWGLLGYGFWVVRDLESGRFLGEIGLGDMRRPITDRFEAPEAGWAFLPEAQGRGLAGEALKAVLRFADERRSEAVRTVCMIEPDNIASIRLAERHGYRVYADTLYRGGRVLLFERPRGGRIPSP